MEEEKRKAYSEVVEILKLIEDEKKLEKIPFEVIELIKRNAEPGYKPNISKDIPLEEQNLRNEAYSILSWIANKYWSESINDAENEFTDNMKEAEENLSDNKSQEFNEEAQANNSIESSIKEEYIKIHTLNEEQSGAPYNDIDPSSLEISNLPVLVNEEKWYQKLKKQVIKLFKLIFGIKDKDEQNNLI